MEGTLLNKLYKHTPMKQTALNDLVLILLGAFILGLLAQVRFFIPNNPVPITGQTFGVLVFGSIYGYKRGVITMLTYIILGIIGFPVFTNGQSGFMHLVGPSGGYIIGFIFCAGFIGYLTEKAWIKTRIQLFIGFIIGEFFIYIFGLLYLSIYVPLANLVQIGLVPFLIGDLIKLLVAVLFIPMLSKTDKVVRFQNKF